MSEKRTSGTQPHPHPNPPPEGEGIKKVAYHDGPPAISFFGMDWTRGVAREVTTMQWEGMQCRGDFKEFDFRVAAQPTLVAAKTDTKE